MQRTTAPKTKRKGNANIETDEHIMYRKRAQTIDWSQRNPREGSLREHGSIYRSVAVLPRISPFDFGDHPIFAGQAAQLACMVPVGDTPIEIVWTYEGELLPQYMGYNIGKPAPRISTLLIEPVTPEHDGRYACVASNLSGKTVHEATLRVHG